MFGFLVAFVERPTADCTASGALAATGQYDEDDKEADEIWEAVDNFMDERRRVSGQGVVRGGRRRRSSGCVVAEGMLEMR